MSTTVSTRMGDRQERPSAMNRCPFVGDVDLNLWPNVYNYSRRRASWHGRKMDETKVICCRNICKVHSHPVHIYIYIIGCTEIEYTHIMFSDYIWPWLSVAMTNRLYSHYRKMNQTKNLCFHSSCFIIFFSLLIIINLFSSSHYEL